MIKKNCLVGQSGGPTAVINSSIYGIIKESFKHEEIDIVYGAINGIMGVINGNLYNLSLLSKENLNLLKQTPSAILGSVRYCLNDDIKHEDYQKILNTFKKYNIGYFLYIGGNDSMDTVMKLTKFLKENNYDCKIIGVPKTVDNDLVITDHTPGYGSAIKFIANTVSQIRQDTNCYQKGRVTIVEIMGRDAGWLTAGSKLACLNGNAPDLIYLAEPYFDIDDFILKVKKIYDEKQKVLICISEGIKNKRGNFIAIEYASNIDSDVFGHVQLGGTSNILTQIVKERLNLPVRAIELNLLQRCASNISSLVDINEAANCGSFALKQALKGQSGKMVAMIRINNEPYKIKYKLVNINQIANKVKYFPKEWIIDNCDISEEFIKYATPLINKEYKCKYENGILKYTKL